jgi:3-dehydrosphinganine reductase
MFMAKKAANPVAGKTYLVTGGASGIGLATAKLLKAHGAKVALWDANGVALQTVRDELKVPGWVVDVTYSEQVQQIMQETVNTLTRLDGIIHSAGILKTGLFTDLTIKEQSRLVEVNLGGSLNVAHAALPYLKVTKGSLVFLGSISSFIGGADFVAYSASKAGVLSLAEGLRVEVKPEGVHVGAVFPNAVATPMMLNPENQARSTSSRLTPMLTPEVVAQAILKGLQNRSFMIFPTWSSRLIFWITRYGYFLTYPLAVRYWKPPTR